MKRKVIVLLAAIAAVMLLGGCSGDFVSVPEDMTTEEAIESLSKLYNEMYAPEETSAPVTSEAETTAEEKEYSLLNLTAAEQLKIRLKCPLFEGKLNELTIKWKNEATLPSDKLSIARENDRRIFINDEIKYLNMGDNSNQFQTPGEFKTEYDIDWHDTLFTIQNNNDWEITDTTTKYSVYHINTNAFVRKDGGQYDIIIDPAYMYGLPLLDSGLVSTKYDINGTSVTADTLRLKSTNFDASDLVGITADYIYAKVNLYDVNVSYNNQDGYQTNCNFVSFEKITDDTDSILLQPYALPEDDTKDPEMAEVYNTIMANMGTIYNDETNGINLMDLDFDGTPELLVSRSKENSTFYADIDVYRIQGGELKFIDTFNNNVIRGDGAPGNDLIRKGDTNTWYQISYCDRANYNNATTEGIGYASNEVLYEMTLNGNKLSFKEIVKETGVYNYDTDTDEQQLWYMGEPVNVEFTPCTDDTDGMAFDTYSFMGYSSFFMYGLKSEIMSDLLNNEANTSYELYSSFLCDYATHAYSDDKVKLLPDIRTLSYDIAYLTDAFYLGNYDINTKQNYYGFVGAMAKPVIYLYPEEPTDVSVKVTLNDGELTTTYPDYRDGWSVTAEPDGTLTDKADGRKHSYLYWEGEGYGVWDFSSGFCIQKNELIPFLQEKLSILGLTDSEANEFIVYWLPIMQKNEYNIVAFQTTAYENAVKLDVSPAPDSELRVFMTFMAADKATVIPEQTLENFERRGFCVVEWGGMECIAENN